jgi:hypothetical protein
LTDTFFYQLIEKSLDTYQMLDVKRWDLLVLIIGLLFLLFFFTKCSIKCGANGEPYEDADMSSSLSSMGWASGRPLAFATADIGKIGLYYIERPVRSTEAYALANSLGGVIAGESCIRMMIGKGDTLISDTPQLILANNPASGGMLDVGRIRNGDELITTGHPLEGDAVADGMFLYGPIPKGMGVPIYYDPDAYYSSQCNVDLQV